MKQANDQFYRTILDTIPHMVFIVDEDVRILDLNAAALSVCGPDRLVVFKRRGGEVIHCLHAGDVPEGCGRGPACPTCIIRNSVTASLRGRSVTREWTRVEIQRDGKTEEHDMLITASPLPSDHDHLALLILEDISELSNLRDLVPICAKCKKIRDDKDYWQSVEAYVHEHTGMKFTHGMCPTCMEELYPQYIARKKEAADLKRKGLES